VGGAAALSIGTVIIHKLNISLVACNRTASVINHQTKVEEQGDLAGRGGRVGETGPNPSQRPAKLKRTGEAGKSPRRNPPAAAPGALSGSPP
jgi:hypothetical protein